MSWHHRAADRYHAPADDNHQSTDLRFERPFGLAAMLAAGHEIAASLAFVQYLDLEVTLVLVAVLLTVLGYSLNDTVVVFERLCENVPKHRGRNFFEILNQSIKETVPRTLLTNGTNLAAAFVLPFLAGDVIWLFALLMSFGVVLETFSSIFGAAHRLLWVERRGDIGAHRQAERRRQMSPPNR